MNKYRKTIIGNLDALKQLHSLLEEAIKNPVPILSWASENETEILAVELNPNQKGLIFMSEVYKE